MRRQITFRGRVQGVGFRATARAIALRHRVSGWVRNEPDGSVLLEVQGDPAAVEAFLEALQTAMGRNIAAADATDIPDVTAAAAAQFEIRY